MTDIVVWAKALASTFEHEGVTQWVLDGYHIRVGPDFVVGGYDGRIFLGPSGFALTFLDRGIVARVMQQAARQWTSGGDIPPVYQDRFPMTPLSWMRAVEIYKEAAAYRSQEDVMRRLRLANDSGPSSEHRWPFLAQKT